MSNENPPEETVTFHPNHPIWISLDDDDWNGATFSNFLPQLKNCNVILQPGPFHSLDLISRMREVLERNCKSVTLDCTAQIQEKSLS